MGMAPARSLSVPQHRIQTKYTYPSRHAALTVNRTLQTLPATSVDWTSLAPTCKRGIPVLRRVNEARLLVYSSWLIWRSIHRTLLPVGLGILNLGIVKLGLSMSDGFGCWHLVIEILLRIMSDELKLRV
jgi:hypothetical protein